VAFQKLREMTEEDILSDIMRLRFNIENYVKKDMFSFENIWQIFIRIHHSFKEKP